MSPPVTPARIRDLAETGLDALARRGADDARLAVAALHALGCLRHELERRAGPRARDQFDDWLHELLLRREIRARQFGLPAGSLPTSAALPPAEAMAVEMLVDAVLAEVEAAGLPVLALAFAEFLLDRLEAHIGGPPPRAPMIARLLDESRRLGPRLPEGEARLH